MLSVLTSVEVLVSLAALGVAIWAHVRASRISRESNALQARLECIALPRDARGAHVGPDGYAQRGQRHEDFHRCEHTQHGLRYHFLDHAHDVVLDGTISVISACCQCHLAIMRSSESPVCVTCA